MIIREDADLEAAVREGILDIAVPVSVFVPADGGETRITSFECTCDICRAFEERFGSDPFTAEATEELLSLVSPVMKDFGYTVDRKASRVILEYVADDASRIYGGDAARLVFSSEEIGDVPCPLLHKPEPEEDFPCAVVVVDGKIVAMAGINDFSDDGLTEIHTETAPEYRGRGYATDAVAALARYLIGEGESVGYICGEDNPASARVAEKAGFSLCGRRFSVVAYADED